MKTGCVYLIGAGCGDPGLLTLRAKALLEGCSCVVYDDLIHPAILDFAPPGAPRIYMGKRMGRHSARQEEINAQLVELARQGHTVARLKGGDPFVFGRGGEEFLALNRAGIPCEEVPGITSAIAIPAAAGIPVTHRGMSRSLHIITGHTAQGLPSDLDRLGGLEGTLVFLMGLSHLEEIADGLMAGGRSPSTPAAVLSGGNSPNPATVRGTLGDIARRAAGVKSPAVIVVGETAGLDLSSTLPAPLRGLRVGLTGTAAFTLKLTRQLEALGASPRLICPAETLPLEVPPLDFLTLPHPKWVVLTSVNGVERLFEVFRQQRIDLRQLTACRFAVIGPATGEALARHGILPDLCPRVYTSEALARALVERSAPEEPLYLLRSDKGSPILADHPRSVGRTLRDIPTYTTRPAEVPPSLTPEGLDGVVFASAGGVRDYFARWHTLPEGCRGVCIGPVTAREAAKFTESPLLVAHEATGDGILSLLQTLI